MSTLNEKQEKLNGLAADIRSLAEKSNDKEFDWTAEHDGQWDTVNAEYNALRSEIESDLQREERQQRASEIAEYGDRLASERKKAPGFDDATGGGDDSRSVEITTETRVAALQGWMRRGEELSVTDEQANALQKLGLRADATFIDIDFSKHRRSVPRGHAAFCYEGRVKLPETRDLGVVVGTKGKETVPEGFVYELEKAMIAFNGPRQVCRIMSTASGNPMPWPTVNDTGNSGAILAENTSIGSSVDPTFGQVVFGAYKYSSTPILVAQELLEDSAFNLGVELGTMIGERIGRKTAVDFTTGTGTGQPNGIVTDSQLGITSSSVDGFTADNLIDLSHTVDPEYRSLSSVGYMMHDLITATVRKFKDSQGQYLWQPSLQLGVPDRFNGYPIAINQQMASTISAATPIALFGAFEKFVIRDAAAMRFYRLEERYRDMDQAGFVAFSRHDSKSIQGPAIKHLISAAS